MPFCTACGAPLEGDAAVCAACGAAQGSEKKPAYAQRSSYHVPASQGGYASAGPAYVYANPKKDASKVLSVGAWLGALVVMSLPLVGLVMQILWACGACRSRNLRNLARAWLILSVIGLLLAFLAYTSLREALPQLREALEQFLPQLAEWAGG